MQKGLFEVKPIEAAPHVDAGEPVEQQPARAPGAGGDGWMRTR